MNTWVNIGHYSHIVIVNNGPLLSQCASNDQHLHCYVFMSFLAQCYQSVGEKLDDQMHRAIQFFNGWLSSDKISVLWLVRTLIFSMAKHSEIDCFWPLKNWRIWPLHWVFWPFCFLPHHYHPPLTVNVQVMTIWKLLLFLPHPLLYWPSTSRYKHGSIIDLV